jgi:hypothetical protein
MLYLKEVEIKEQSVIVIEFENGSKAPYFVGRKLGFEKDKMELLGIRLEQIVSCPEMFDNFKESDRFCIAMVGKKACNKGVKGYLPLNDEERKTWQGKVEGQPLFDDLMKALQN